MKKTPRIIVAGSLNMDLVANTSRLPLPGETVMGKSFCMVPGGKGANQAVAASRLEAEVIMIGSIGSDTFGQTLRTQLIEAGVDVRGITEVPGESSGIALINVDMEGRNSITVVPGANDALGPKEIADHLELILQADVVIVQLEIPLETVIRVVEVASEHNIPVILNPAPACPLPEHLLRQIYLLTPNETEASILTGIDIHDVDDAKRAARYLHDKGVKNVIITMGEKGSWVSTPAVDMLVPAHRVNVVDTTAAGDAYTGALGVAIGKGDSIVAAAKYAGVVAALSVTRAGAQPSLPTQSEVETFMRSLLTK
jgi:ribokinase